MFLRKSMRSLRFLGCVQCLPCLRKTHDAKALIGRPRHKRQRLWSKTGVFRRVCQRHLLPIPPSAKTCKTTAAVPQGVPARCISDSRCPEMLMIRQSRASFGQAICAATNSHFQRSARPASPVIHCSGFECQQTRRAIRTGQSCAAIFISAGCLFTHIPTAWLRPNSQKQSHTYVIYS
jgi:hypothetical protein